jgi:hypothetical protein
MMSYTNSILGNCGPPSPPQYGYINPYTRTLEGVEITVTCPQENLTTQSVCEREGNWSPDTGQLCTNFTTGIIIPCTIVMIICRPSLIL